MPNKLPNGQISSKAKNSGQPIARGSVDSPPNRLREIRKRKGLTQEELAARVGLCGAHISRFEKGRRQLSLEWMKRLGDALECSPALLLPPGLNENAAQPASDETAAETLPPAESDLAARLLKALIAAGLDSDEVGRIIALYLEGEKRLTAQSDPL